MTLLTVISKIHLDGYVDVDNGEYISIHFSITARNLNAPWSILRLLAINPREITRSIVFVSFVLSILNLCSVLGKLTDCAIIALVKLLGTFSTFSYILIRVAVNFIGGNISIILTMLRFQYIYLVCVNIRLLIME